MERRIPTKVEIWSELTPEETGSVPVLRTIGAVNEQITLVGTPVILSEEPTHENNLKHKLLPDGQPDRNYAKHVIRNTTKQVFNDEKKKRLLRRRDPCLVSRRKGTIMA